MPGHAERRPRRLRRRPDRLRRQRPRPAHHRRRRARRRTRGDGYDSDAARPGAARRLAAAARPGFAGWRRRLRRLRHDRPARLQRRRLRRRFAGFFDAQADARRHEAAGSAGRWRRSAAVRPASAIGAGRFGCRRRRIGRRRPALRPRARPAPARATSTTGSGGDCARRGSGIATGASTGVASATGSSFGPRRRAPAA